MLQLCFLEQKKGTEWYLKFFKRILSVAVYNTMVMYRSFSNNKNMDPQKFRLLAEQGMWKIIVLVFLTLYMATHHLNHCLKDSQNNISWSIFLSLGRRHNLKENIWCAQNTGNGENLFTGVVNV
jgi:hypothetical protein